MNRQLAVAICLSMAGSASAQLTMTVSSPPVGASAAVLKSMTPDGKSAVGFAQMPNGTTLPVRWSAAGGLNFLSYNGTWHDAGAQCISPDGASIFGYMRFSDLHYKMVSWINFTRTEYANLPAGLTEISPQAMNSTASNIFGWVTQTGSTEIRAARVKPNGQWVLLNQTFPNNAAATRSSVIDVSDNGLVACGNSWIGDVCHAVRWTLTPAGTSTMQDLGALPGGASAIAFAESSDGSVVVGRGATASTDKAWQWRPNTGMLALPSIAGDAISAASNLSANAHVVVGYAYVGGVTRARLWIDGQVHDFADYMQARGVDMAGWTQTSLDAASNDGSVVTGNGKLNGASRTFIAQLRCPADLDFDGAVDLSDFFAFFNAFDTSSLGADVNNDSQVDLADFFDFFNHFDNAC